MATILPSTAGRADAEGDQTVVLRGVGWDGYRTLLRLRGGGHVPRMVYLDGDVHLMSPSFPHEHLAERLGLLVMVVVEELDIPCVVAGSTTFRRRKKKGGVEGDKTFYLANEAKIRGKPRIRLRYDPPPDLVIEAVYTHEADAAVEVWRRFRAPEVWVCDGRNLEILHINPEGNYSLAGASRSFPFLTAAEIVGKVAEAADEPDTNWIKGVRRWVRDEVAPRLAGREGKTGQDQAPDAR